MTPEKAIFNPMPARFPTNTPQPTRKAFSLSLPANNSPMTAPINPPMNIPKGGKTRSPMSNPKTDPQVPNFDAPYFFAPAAGTT